MMAQWMVSVSGDTVVIPMATWMSPFGRINVMEWTN